jgi:hypothetical protein
MSASFLHALVAPAFTINAHPPKHFLNAIIIAYNHAIADTGTTSIFIMEVVQATNKHVTVKPLTINLLDAKKVMSTHVCDINIPGLPIVLTGHIVPSLSIVSFIGIHPL